MAPPASGSDFNPLVHEVARLGGDVTDFWPQLDERLQPVLGYDSATFTTIDPPTLLWTTRCVTGMESSPARERKVLELELRGDDLNSFPALLMQQMPIGSLHTACGGDLSATIRYEDLLASLDLADELRAVVRSEGLNWGLLTLYRKHGREPFVYKELRAMRDTLGSMADLIRLRMLRAAADEPGRAERPPGLIRLASDGTERERTPQADARLEAVKDPAEVEAAVAAVSQRYLDGDALASATVPTGDDASVTLHASPGPDGSLDLVVEEDRIVTLDRRVVDAYGFTEDEVEVLFFYAQGRTTRTIAQILAIDAFQVQAWLMSMFEKTGTQNRADFLARIYSDHYGPRLAAGARPSPYGFFLDDVDESSQPSAGGAAPVI